MHTKKIFSFSPLSLSQIAILFGCLFAMSIQALADRPRPQDRSVMLSSDDYKIYLDTIQRCAGTSRIRAAWRGINKNVISGSAKEIAGLYFFNIDTYFSIVENKGLSAEFSQILHSMGLYYALEDCYGTDDVAKQSYFLGLFASDIFGKYAAVKIPILALRHLGLALLFRNLSPYVTSVFKAAGMTAVIYFTYKTIRQEFLPRTAEEKEKIEEQQAQAFENPIPYVESAKTLIRKRIEDIEESLKARDLNPEEKLRLETKLTDLQAALQKIIELQSQV